MVCGDVTITLNSVADSTLLPIGQPGIILVKKYCVLYHTKKLILILKLKSVNLISN